MSLLSGQDWTEKYAISILFHLIAHCEYGHAVGITVVYLKEGDLMQGCECCLRGLF
jgi:hypothetical protein